MEAERWQRINEILEAALKKPPKGRVAFLAETCRGDELLQREVEALLAAKEVATESIETPAVEKAAGSPIDGRQGPPARVMLPPDTVLLGRYRIIRCIGQGGMGTVYEALDQRVNCPVALKEMYAGNDNSARRAFEREASLLGNLRHSALPKVTDYFSEGGRDFLVMEFIPGSDLAELLASRDRPFSPTQVIGWADKLLAVLDYLHGQQPPILHRDIKPSNLKLTRAEEIFLLDFGLAKGSTAQMGKLITNRSVAGYTPVYASLEQIRGQGTDPRSDLYSLGATLYHLLTGTRPADAPTRVRVIEENQPDPLQPIEKLNPQISTEIAAVIHRAMSVNRSQRPASAAEMREALRNAVDGNKPRAVQITCPSCHAGIPSHAEFCDLCGARIKPRGATMTEMRSWIIGSAPESDLRVDHPKVSWQHCRLTQEADSFWLEDLGSTNGTYLNQYRISQRVKVTRDDQIILGQSLPMPWPEPSQQHGVRCIRIGRDQDNNVRLDYPMISSHHARILLSGGSAVIEDLDSTNGTAIGSPERKIKHAQISPDDTVYLGSYRVPAAKLLEGSLALGERANTKLDFTGKTMTLGRDPECEQVLDYPMVSWRHARLSRAGSDVIVEDLGSTNGTYVNGQRISGSLKVHPGDVIGLGSYTFGLTASGEIEKRDYHGDLTIEARNVAVAVPGRKLLEDVSLTIYPSELVGLMGPAGAGKSTLMHALNGYAAPTVGQVLFNGQNLYHDYAQFSVHIGYVPQDDIMHRDLTVRQALFYSARLRLPADYSDAEIEKRIGKVINQLGLESAQDVRIGSPEKRGISGGQRKRVNLAMELLTDPSVLFLDEPTSGLSSEDALMVMKLLRQLADAGKTILITIHQPSLEVFRLMDNLVVIGKEWNSAQPGRLVYYGPAHPHAQRFFNPDGLTLVEDGSFKSDNPRPEEVLRGLDMRKITEWCARYQASEYQQQYVDQRRGTHNQAAKELKDKITRQPGLGQWRTLVKRCFAIKLKDAWMTAILLAQAPIIGMVIWLVLSKQLHVEPVSETAAEWKDVAGALSTTIFLMTVAALWFGCSNSAREIVGEWAVYRRERMVNLKIPSYIASKFTVLGALCVIQCAVLLAFVYLTCNLKGPFLPMFVLLLMTSLVGVALGLTTSTLARTSEAAIALVPLILLPMIILGGALFPVHQMPLPRVADFIPSRWAFEGMLVQEVKAHGNGVQPEINCSDPSLPASSSPQANLVRADMGYTRFPTCRRNGVEVDATVLALTLAVLAAGMLVILKLRDVHR